MVKHRLDGLHPELVKKLERIITAMDALGFPIMVFEGLRTAERQHDLWKQGREKPGAIVTKADGFDKKSAHQAQSDGYGYAADCVFLDKGKPSWDTKHPWDLLGAVAKSQGLAWGGDWGWDRPHVELKKVAR